jgi:uncharacterized protein YbbC (DUF1343 family)
MMRPANGRDCLVSSSMRPMRTSFPRSTQRANRFAHLLLLVFLLSLSQARPQAKILPSPERVKLGNEVLFQQFPAELRDKRLGLVINQTSVLPNGPTLLARLLAEGYRVTAIFTPEHGLAGAAEGGRPIEDGLWQQIKVYSLYGKQLRPSPEQLRDVDALIYDIQDVGTRFYTYITTLKYVLEAAAAASVPVCVLDRPNPLGGRIVEGPVLKKQYESFIAALPIPTRYGLTAGELALMMKGEGWVPGSVSLQVIRMANWTRNQTWGSTGLPWIPTSPNIPTPESALPYPGTGLFGGIRLNQGLGTPHPFRQFGAPWLDPEVLLSRLPGEEGLRARLSPVTYTPVAMPDKVMTPPYKDRLCRGLRLLVLDEERFLSLRFALIVIKTLKDLYPKEISVGSALLDQMFGDDSLTRFIEGKLPLEELMRLMEVDEKAFDQQRQRYLLYPDQE